MALRNAGFDPSAGRLRNEPNRARTSHTCAPISRTDARADARMVAQLRVRRIEAAAKVARLARRYRPRPTQHGSCPQMAGGKGHVAPAGSQQQQPLQMIQLFVTECGWHTSSHVGAAPPVLMPPVFGALPVAGLPPVAGAPPVAGLPPVPGAPPVAGLPPVARAPPVASRPPALVVPPVTGTPPAPPPFVPPVSAVPPAPPSPIVPPIPKAPPAPPLPTAPPAAPSPGAPPRAMAPAAPPVFVAPPLPPLQDEPPVFDALPPVLPTGEPAPPSGVTPSLSASPSPHAATPTEEEAPVTTMIRNKRSIFTGPGAYGRIRIQLLVRDGNASRLTEESTRGPGRRTLRRSGGSTC